MEAINIDQSSCSLNVIMVPFACSDLFLMYGGSYERSSGAYRHKRVLRGAEIKRSGSKCEGMIM